MRGCGVVVDHERQTALLGHGLEVPEHLLLRRRSIRDRREQPRVGARGSGVPGELDRLIRAERPDPDEDRHPASHRSGGDLHGATSLVPGQVGVGSGAAEQANGIDSGIDQALQQPIQARRIDVAVGVARGDRKGGKTGDRVGHGGMIAALLQYAQAKKEAPAVARRGLLVPNP